MPSRVRKYHLITNDLSSVRVPRRARRKTARILFIFKTNSGMLIIAQWSVLPCRQNRDIPIYRRERRQYNRKKKKIFKIQVNIAINYKILYVSITESSSRYIRFALKLRLLNKGPFPETAIALCSKRFMYRGKCRQGENHTVTIVDRGKGERSTDNL